MRPKKYPYSGLKNSKRLASENEFGIVSFPNIAISKKLLKHIYTVVRQNNGTTIIYFRIPNILGYEGQRARINLSYDNVIKILNETN